MTFVMFVLATAAVGPSACAEQSQTTPTISDHEACMNGTTGGAESAIQACVRTLKALQVDRDRAQVRARLAQLEGNLPLGSQVRGEAALTAAVLFAFLNDGEDGCTCRSDLRSLVKTFQEAHNVDTLGRGPRSASPATGALPTHGYFESSTAAALALYSGQWQVPCYGDLGSRCGDVPAASASTAGATDVLVAAGEPDVITAAGTSARSGGGCRPWDFGVPGGGATCNEVLLLDDAARSTDDTAGATTTLQAQSRAACGNGRAGRLIQDRVYDARGCPADNRLAGCGATDTVDPRIVRVEWFYAGTESVDQVRERCTKSNRALVLQ